MMGKNKKEILILGVGNPLRRDDGIGPEIIRLFEENRIKKNNSYKLPADTDLVDGGTDGLGLIEYLKDYKKVVIIDAVEMKSTPGTIKVFTPEKAVIKIGTDSLSTHGFCIGELIKLADALDINTKIIIVGIQPESTDFGEGLSGSVQSKITRIIKVIIQALDSISQAEPEVRV